MYALFVQLAAQAHACISLTAMGIACRTVPKLDLLHCSARFPLPATLLPS